MKKTIINPVIKDQVTFTQTALETNGRITSLLVKLMPGGGTPMHYHTNFSETFAVVEGALTLTTKKGKLRLLPGQKYTVEKGIAHRFSNEGGEPVTFTTIILPGSTGFENALRILYGLAEDGATNKKGVPKSLQSLAVISNMSDMHASGIGAIFTPLFGILIRIAKRRGLEKKLLEQYCI